MLGMESTEHEKDLHRTLCRRMSDNFRDFWEARARSPEEAAVALVPALEATFAFWDYMRDLKLKENPGEADRIRGEWAQRKGNLYEYLTSGDLALKKRKDSAPAAA